MKASSQIQRKTIIKLKMIVQLSKGVNKWKKQFSNSKHRFYVLRQWYETQSSYIEDLYTIQNDIQRPLKSANLITAQEERLLFPNIKGIMELSENMKNCLKEKVATWNPITTMIGQSLMFYSQFFMIYSQYYKNSAKACQILTLLEQHPQIPKIKANLKLFRLEDYAKKPEQRPMKYTLLLKDYLRSLPKNHKDYKNVQLAKDKYEQVNSKNNRSLDRQIKDKQMIRLHQKYGNIISDRKPGRSFVKSFASKCLNFKCIVHVFNDLILILQKKNEDGQHFYKSLQLDGTSYIMTKKQLKYYQNVVFVCGTHNAIHLSFDTSADCQIFEDQIQSIINDLYKSQEERKTRFVETEEKKRNLAKIKVKFHQEKRRQIMYRPKLQINVQSIIKSKSQVYFIIKLKIINPYKSCQTIMVSLDNMLSVLSCLKITHKNFQYARLRQTPAQFGFIQTVMNKRKIIQFRSFAIQHFLNLVFRYCNFNQNWKFVADQIGVFPSLFWFSTENFQCQCNQCVQIKIDQPIQYYLLLMKQLRKNKKLHHSSSSKPNFYSNEKQKNDQIPSNSKKPKLKPNQQCYSYIFNLLNYMKGCEKLHLTNLFQKMLVLQAEMGQINYILFPLQNTPLRANVNIKIYLLNIEQQYIEIRLKKDKYVRQILQEIGFNNSLESVYDWGLYLYYEGQYTYISNDQKLLDFVNKWGIDIEKTQQEVDDDSFFGQKIDSLKKWGEQFWGSKKGKIFMKKHLHFQHQLQIEACKDNKQRYHFLINEVFGRIRYENLKLSDSQLISICSFFLIKNEFEKVKYWTVDNIDLNPLKELLPTQRQHLLKANKFKEQIVDEIKKNYTQLQKFQNSRNAIEIIYLKTLNFLKNNEQWVTKYFQLTTFESQIANDVQIGVNYNYFIVMKSKQRRNIMEIELNRLKYTANLTTIYVNQGEKVYRYDGMEVYTIRKLIQTYLAYAKLFSASN